MYAGVLPERFTVDRVEHAPRALHANHLRAVLQHSAQQRAARLHRLQRLTQDEWRAGSPRHRTEQQTPAVRRGQDRQVHGVHAGELYSSHKCQCLLSYEIKKITRHY